VELCCIQAIDRAHRRSWFGSSRSRQRPDQFFQRQAGEALHNFHFRSCTYLRTFHLDRADSRWTWPVTMSQIRFEAIAKSYDTARILTGIDFAVEEGSFAVVFGPPASGKSVLLRILVGLETQDSGKVEIRGTNASNLNPGNRNIGYVPQSFALFPNKSVRDNIGYPLMLAGKKGNDATQRIQRVAELLDIAGLLDRRPDQLSGGQKQRVAIARGLVPETGIYVLDDPLVGLDFKLRERLVDDLRTTREELDATFLYATSDAGEAMSLGSHIAILSAGEVVEYGPPHSLYLDPQRFETMTRLCFPEANVIEGQIHITSSGTNFVTQIGTIPVNLDEECEHGRPLVGVVRSEHIALNPDNTSIRFSVGLRSKAVVTMTENLGAEEIVYLDAMGVALTGLLRSDSTQSDTHTLGMHTHLRIDSEQVVLFDGSRRIGQGSSETTLRVTGALEDKKVSSHD
jgi:ABC-type sugar transport system ATPase subunit